MASESKLMAQSNHPTIVDVPGLGPIVLGYISFGGLTRAETAMVGAPDAIRGKVFLSILVEDAARGSAINSDVLMTVDDNALNILTDYVAEQLELFEEYNQTDESQPCYDRLLAAWRKQCSREYSDMASIARIALDETENTLAAAHAAAISSLVAFDLQAPTVELLEITRTASLLGTADMVRQLAGPIDFLDKIALNTPMLDAFSSASSSMRLIPDSFLTGIQANSKWLEDLNQTFSSVARTLVEQTTHNMKALEIVDTTLWKEHSTQILASLANTGISEAIERSLHISEEIQSDWLAKIGETLMPYTSAAMEEALRTSGLLDAVRKPLWLRELDDYVGSILQTDDLFKGMSLTEPYLSSSLIASGVNSPLIHSPTYPAFRPPRTSEQEVIAVSAAEAHRQRRLGAFDTLDQLEHALRRFIEVKLRATFGDEWWARGVPSYIRRECETRKLNKEKPGEQGFEPLSYAYIEELGRIVIEGRNWNDIFQVHFRDHKETEVAFVRCNRVRPTIAHSRDLSDEDYTMFSFEARRLIRLAAR